MVDKGHKFETTSLISFVSFLFRMAGSTRLPVLSPPFRGDDVRNSPRDMQVVPRASQSRMDVLEDRVMQQEKATHHLIDRAYKIKEDIIENLNYTHGTWQDEKHARELLQEHIRTITDVVRKLGRDIQV